MTPMALDITIGTPTHIDRGNDIAVQKHENPTDYDAVAPADLRPTTAPKRIPIRFICDFNKLSNFGQELFSCNRNILV